MGYFVFQSASGGLFFVERHRGMSAFARLKTRMRGHRCPLVAGAIFAVLLSLGFPSEGQAQVSPPTITNVNPNTGPAAGGTSVTITGTNLNGATAVRPVLAAGSFTVNGATQITATSPAGTGTVDVTVTTPGGTSAPSSADQFGYVSAPTVTGINPITGPPAGGTSVTITGTNLNGATAVRFGDTMTRLLYGQQRNPNHRDFPGWDRDH